MKGKLTVLSISILMLFSFNYAQLKLTDKVYTVSEKDWMELKLLTLSNKLSSGSFIIEDMGSFNLPVNIKLDKENFISFTIYYKEKLLFEDKIILKILEENLDFLIVAIRELMEKDFVSHGFTPVKDIRGCWKLIGSPTNIAIVENGIIKLVK